MKFECKIWPGELAKKLIDAAKQSEDQYEEAVSALHYLKAAAENPLNHDYFRTMYKTLEAVVERIPENLDRVTSESNTAKKLLRSCSEDRLFHLVEADRAGNLAEIPSVRKNSMGWDLLD